MTWLFITLLSYLFFSVASLGDKLVLNRSQNPRLYIFYVGILGLVVLPLIPFVDFSIPDAKSFLWIILTSLVFLMSLYFLYSAVNKFEVSRVVPLIGAVQPIFILLLSWFFFTKTALELKNLLVFLTLLIAGFLISFEKNMKVTLNLLKLSLISSFLTALSLIFIKMVFLRENFLSGIIWIGILNFLFVLFFLFDNNFRKNLFLKKSFFDKKTVFLLIFTQSAGGLAGILQNLAIYLAPTTNLALINALKGIQYGFLFLITLFFSFFAPTIFKEEVSLKIIIQKSLGIFLIIISLAILIL